MRLFNGVSDFEGILRGKPYRINISQEDTIDQSIINVERITQTCKARVEILDLDCKLMVRPYMNLPQIFQADNIIDPIDDLVCLWMLIKVDHLRRRRSRGSCIDFGIGISISIVKSRGMHGV